MKLKFLPDNMIYNIIEYIDSFNDFKNIKLLNKFYNKLCIDFWKIRKESNDELYPQRTMLCFKSCKNCNRNVRHKNVQLYVDYEYYPRPIYVLCSQWRCAHNCMLNLFVRAWNYKIIYLDKNNDFPKEHLIPRSSGEKTLARIGNSFIRISNNQVYIRAEWIDDKGNAYDKYVPNEYFNFKIKISTWYKSHKLIDGDEEIDLDINELLQYEN